MSALVVPQPEYRALMVLNEIPNHCTAIMCRDDRSLPHIRSGEWVIIDPTDRTPRHGELFVVKFGEGLFQQHICMARRRHNVGWVDQQYGPHGWTIGAIRNDEMRRVMDRLEDRKKDGLLSDLEFNKALIEANNLTGAWVEGPYQDGGTSYEHLCSILRGAVIGLYQATEHATNTVPS